MERVDAWVQTFRSMSKEEQLEGLRRLTIRPTEYATLESRLRARFEASGLLESRSSAVSADSGGAASPTRGRADTSSAELDAWTTTTWEDEDAAARASAAARVRPVERSCADASPRSGTSACAAGAAAANSHTPARRTDADGSGTPRSGTPRSAGRNASRARGEPTIAWEMRTLDRLAESVSGADTRALTTHEPVQAEGRSSAAAHNKWTSQLRPHTSPCAPRSESRTARSRPRGAIYPVTPPRPSLAQGQGVQRIGCHTAARSQCCQAVCTRTLHLAQSGTRALPEPARRRTRRSAHARKVGASGERTAATSPTIARQAYPDYYTQTPPATHYTHGHIRCYDSMQHPATIGIPVRARPLLSNS